MWFRDSKPSYSDLIQFIKRFTRHEEILMTAVADLTTAVTRLSASVDAATAKLGAPAVDDPAVTAAVVALNAASDKLDAAVAAKV